MTRSKQKRRSLLRRQLEAGFRKQISWGPWLSDDCSVFLGTPKWLILWYFKEISKSLVIKRWYTFYPQAAEREEALKKKLQASQEMVEKAIDAADSASFPVSWSSKDTERCKSSSSGLDFFWRHADTLCQAAHWHDLHCIDMHKWHKSLNHPRLDLEDLPMNRSELNWRSEKEA